MASQFEKKYRTKGDNLDDDFFNKRFKDVDLRLVAVEEAVQSLDSVSNVLIERGLTYISTELQAKIGLIQTQIDDTAALMEGLQEAVEEAIETLNDNLIIDAGTY